MNRYEPTLLQGSFRTPSGRGSGGKDGVGRGDLDGDADPRVPNTGLVDKDICRRTPTSIPIVPLVPVRDRLPPPSLNGVFDGRGRRKYCARTQTCLSPKAGSPLPPPFSPFPGTVPPDLSGFRDGESGDGSRDLTNSSFIDGSDRLRESVGVAQTPINRE